ncbi:hypothetical protein L6452_33324 [Arctium lappa]|uniref:Uncharacterized protein n=1 Tax=Arctium lappa TaxID=4217 RepID=A0ACB8YGA0_ARCLA|nr:hypothetical protein L6452_33324 [Arctium lappa]
MQSKVNLSSNSLGVVCFELMLSAMTLTPYLKLTMRNPQTIANECGQTVRKCVFLVISRAPNFHRPPIFETSFSPALPECLQGSLSFLESRIWSFC